ncbi:fungal-specific transcription factor domain-containing protein [Radiomyces spectabilis]|uniref:fungal-specific transcription factor domain-containing protein n=1 Tax=Radiomyces spectabilis TaxID=64574 RepID=UPI0022212028|nr:fungal-specific transcription factor domain-containing protein [Radiomyces spectabilis]KAI8373197.1 fungal-specific transcription factor domain-containing protein [Radiomyces spectabilis]
MQTMEGEDYHQKLPGKKRVRATQACILCRKKKIKCDGTKPECLHCQEANLHCEYTECKKRGPRKGYVQLLEDRLVQLERRLTGSVDELSPESLAQPSTGSSFLDHTKDAANVSSSADDECPPNEIVMHLVDLFFKYLNVVFPLVHRATLKQSITDGTVHKPLLWAVMAIGARFSDHPMIKAEPRYWASERFALKARSLIDAELLEPTLPNLQFWGVMASLEYGRANGSKAWMYGGIAIRICQDLGLHKEETLITPILKEDGTIDAIAMALRRRMFWSSKCLDVFTTAGTSRPQCFDRIECDANPPAVSESLILRDTFQSITVDNRTITTDTLIDIPRYYLRMIQVFGEVNKFMARVETNQSSIVWPPVAEFSRLDAMVRAWKDNLPDAFHYTPANLRHHQEHASQNYINYWLTAHVLWCTTMMALHRGSLAYADVNLSDVPKTTYTNIQSSIEACKSCVDTVMPIFKAMRDLCSFNTLPYMGYSSYIFATVLMTSTFSKDEESRKKSGDGLAILYGMIECLRPYWLMCERLAVTTGELLATHNRLYAGQSRPDYAYDNPATKNEGLPFHKFGSSNGKPSSHLSSLHHQPSQPPHSQTTGTGGSSSSIASLLDSNVPNGYLYSSFISGPSIAGNSMVSSSSQPSLTATQQAAPLSLLAESFPDPSGNGQIDFNSSEFLCDSALFGQIMFDGTGSNKPATPGSLFNPMGYSMMPTTYPSYSHMVKPEAATYDGSRSIMVSLPAPSFPSRSNSLWESS